MAGISLAHHNQFNLQKSILHTSYVPVRVYARIGIHDLSPELQKHVNKTVNISITTTQNIF
jgi:hypothetical protein